MLGNTTSAEFLAAAVIAAMAFIGMASIILPFWMFRQTEAILKSEDSTEFKENYEMSLTALAVLGGSLTATSLIVGFWAMRGGVSTLLDNKHYAIYLTICAVLGLFIIVAAQSAKQNIDETAESEQIKDGLKPSMVMDLVTGSGVICSVVAVLFMINISGYQSEGVIGTNSMGEKPGEFGFDFEF